MTMEASEKALYQRLRRKILRRYRTRYALLGDGQGNIGAGLGKVWVRFPAGIDASGNTLLSEPTKVNSGSMYLEYEGAGVRVGVDDNDEQTVVKADERDMRAAGYDMRILNPGNPTNTFFRLKNAIRLLCRAVATGATTSTLVSVRSWIYQDAYGDVNRYEGTPLQADKLDIITGHTPTAAYHRVVIVFLRMVDQSLQIFGSTEQAETSALDFTDYQECFAQSYIDEDVPIQAFHLKNAQTTVDNRDLGEDLRMFLQGQPRYGEENPVTHNRFLRAGQQKIVYDWTVQADVVIQGDIVIL